MKVELATAGETRAFGRALAAVLRAGDLVVLAGPLGAGKTTLAQGIGAGLGVTGTVLSPTFVIARVHRPADGGPAMVHVDAYRLGSVADPRGEVDDLDLDADADESVIVVEWGEGMVEHLAEAHLLVRLTPGPGELRVAEVRGTGGDWRRRLDRLAAGHAWPAPG